MNRYLYGQLRRTELTERWMSKPIVMEVRPEIQVEVFSYEALFDYSMQCIEVTHANYLIVNIPFSMSDPPQRR